MMLYNILYLVKRNVMYKIIVGFFSKVTYYTLELSVTDKILFFFDIFLKLLSGTL